MFVIGAGRIGTALEQRARIHGRPCTLVDRTHGWDALEDDSAPILVTVRNDDLDEVVERVPTSRWPDLVFVQNGMLRDWLAGRDLGGTTRGLLFFAVPVRGAPLQAGAPSPFTGPLAVRVVRWLRSIDIEAELRSGRAFAITELEKLVWNCVFGLLAQAQELSVGALVERHRADIDALARELVGVGAPSFDLRLTDEEVASLVDRLCAYSASIPEYRGAVKEWPWRNGWFVRTARANHMPTPHHDRWLAAIDRLDDDGSPD